MATNFRVFHNEASDDQYWEWMQLNPNGYILNPKRNSKTDDFKYHRPMCMHIADPSPKFSFTTNGKRKLCSNNLSELLTALQKFKSYNGVFSPCASCKPDIGVSNLR